MRYLIRISCVFVFMLGSTALVHGNPSGAESMLLDKDGCWSGTKDGVRPCLVQVDTRLKDGSLKIKFKNQCAIRVYTKVCHYTRTNYWSCSSFGVKAGSTYKYWDSNSTGRTKMKVIGSKKSSKDWVCSGKVKNWSKDQLW